MQLNLPSHRKQWYTRIIERMQIFPGIQAAQDCSLWKKEWAPVKIYNHSSFVLGDNFLLQWKEVGFKQWNCVASLRRQKLESWCTVVTGRHVSMRQWPGEEVAGQSGGPGNLCGVWAQATGWRLASACSGKFLKSKLISLCRAKTWAWILRSEVFSQ